MTDPVTNNLVDENILKAIAGGATTFGAIQDATCMQCPKCHKHSGDDWTQCGGSCPMAQSPHYNPFARLKLGEVYRYSPRLIGARPACNVTLIASHPHDGACLIVEEIDPEDDSEVYFSCEQSDLSESLR